MNRASLPLALLSLWAVVAHAQDSRITPGGRFDWQSALITSGDMVRTTCSDTFTPTTRPITPTNPAAVRTAFASPRLPCAYPPSPTGTRFWATGGLVANYMVTFHQFTANSIRDVGTHRLHCEHEVFAFDTRHVDVLDSTLPIGCGEIVVPREVLWDRLLPTEYTIEVYNTPPVVSVSHSGAGSIAPGNGGQVRAFSDITFDSGARDAEGGTTVSWRIVSKPVTSRAALGAATGATTRIHFSTGESDFGEWILECTVDDQQGERVVQTYLFSVVNQPPRPTLSGANRVRVRNAIMLTATTDEDGGDYTALQWEALRPRSTTWEPIGMPGSLTLSLPTARADLGTWSFRVRVTDNESPALSGTSEPFGVEVYNERPMVMASGPTRIRVGQAFALTNTAVDPDGGPVTVRWVVIQTPNASGVVVGVAEPTFPAANAPGTWVFRARGEDDEGESADSTPVVVVVDADPIAAIEGPASVDVRGAFELRDASWDPDSECAPGAPADPRGCHRVAAGESFTPLSGAVTRWTWFVDSVPTGYELLYPPGRIGETFHGIHSGNSRVLRVEAGQMPVGVYRLRVEVQDAEGTARSATVQVRVLAPQVPPIARINVPARYLVDGAHHPVTPIRFDGSLSFDFDNLLSEIGSPTPGTGITSYLWVFTPPARCELGARVATGPTPTLFATTDTVSDTCMGVWNAALQVTDDDTPTPLTGTRAQDFVIGRCDGLVCIDRPRMDRPQLVDTATPVDVPIYYYVEPTIAARYPGGFYGVIDIIPTGTATPIYTLYDSTISSRPPGTLNLVHWHGERWAGAPGTGLGVASSGTYDVRARILAAGGAYAAESDLAPMAISFENVSATIAATSTRFSRHQDLEAGMSLPRFDWSTTGAISVDGLRFRVTRVGAGVALESTVATTHTSGTFTWNGRTSTSSLLPPGDYTLEVSPLRGTRVLATSAPWRFTVYRLQLGPTSTDPLRVGLNDDDDNGNGARDDGELRVTGENDLLRLAVTVQPGTLAGSLELTAASPGVAVFVGPDKVFAATPSPVPGFTIPDFHVEGRGAGRHDVVLRFTPTGEVALTEERRSLNVVTVNFVDFGGAPLPSLRSALWEQPYDYATVPIVPFNTPGNVFIDSDRDAFAVQVTDPAANLSPTTRDALTVELGTLALWPVPAGTAETWADPLTPIMLRETGVNTGVFESERQILTTNDDVMQPDDLLSVRADYVNANIADESPNDRSHSLMAAGFNPISAGVRVRYGTVSPVAKTTPVCGRVPDERRWVDLRMLALEEPWDDTVIPNGRWDPGEAYVDLSSNMSMMLPDGTPGTDGHGAAITQAGVDAYVRAANLAWAPACIEFRAAPLTMVSWPALIAPAGPLHDGVFTHSTERNAIFTAIRSSSLAGLPLDAITVLFGFSLGEKTPGSAAGFLAITEAPGFRDPTHPAVMIVHGTGLRAFTLRVLAHELGHAMTNQDTDLGASYVEQFYPADSVRPDTGYFFRRFPTAIWTLVRTPRPSAGAPGNAFLKDFSP